MSTKKRIALLYGGRSAEHEISLQSAFHIAKAIDTDKYDIHLIGVTRDGHWYLQNTQQQLTGNDKQLSIDINSDNMVCIIHDGATHKFVGVNKQTLRLCIDVVFPVFHGPYGEDGTIQGLLKFTNVPYVGPDVLSSAVCMDKLMSKRLLKEAQLPTSDFVALQRFNFNDNDLVNIENQLGYPCFVKPANLGSSVGIAKACDQEQLLAAINTAFRYDTKAIVEEFVDGREFECAVLGNEEPIASLPAEIVTQHDFYSYEAKYIDDKGANFIIPADLPKEIIARIQTLAIQAFKSLGCEGMTRVDFFMDTNQQLFINELNTIPGFTPISMYPRMCQASGISYSELIDCLIQLAFERYDREQSLETSFVG